MVIYREVFEYYSENESGWVYSSKERAIAEAKKEYQRNKDDEDFYAVVVYREVDDNEGVFRTIDEVYNSRIDEK